MEQKFRAVINLAQAADGSQGPGFPSAACQLRALVRLGGLPVEHPGTHGFLRPIEVGRNRLELALWGKQPSTTTNHLGLKNEETS